ncbi:MAG: nuclease domain-containing protein [Polyangiaceae bacterium]
MAPVALSGIRLRSRRGGAIQLSATWEPDASANDETCATLIRRSALGVVDDVSALGAVEDGSQLDCQPPDAASLFQAALRVEEGTSWTVRALDGAAAPQVERMGLVALRGHSNAWDWSFEDAVGQTCLEWDGVRVPILVLDRKMPGPDRVQQLEQLVQGVWERHHALLRRLGRPTSVQLENAGCKIPAPIHILMLLDRLIWVGGVHEAWEAIAAEPKTLLEIDWPAVEIARARRPAFHGHHAPWHLARGWFPGASNGRVRDREPLRTPDIPPNRLALRLAMVVERLTEDVLTVLRQSEHPSAAGWQRVAMRIRGRAMRLRAAPSLVHVDAYGALGLDTPTMQQDPVSRPLLSAWSSLQRGITIDSRLESLLHDPLKEAWDLYEYWCWFALCDAVAAVVGSAGKSSRMTQAGDGLLDEADLRHGLVHTFRLTGRIVQIHYNRCAPRVPRDPFWSYSRHFRPDFAISICDDGDKPVLFVLDAKYRVDVAQDDADVSDTEEKAERRGFAKTDDIKVMHAYRDALRTAKGEPPRWVLTLYPGTELCLFATSGTRSADPAALASDTGVGAIPCSPGAGAQAQLQAAVKELLMGAAGGKSHAGHSPS